MRTEHNKRSSWEMENEGKTDQQTPIDRVSKRKEINEGWK